VARIPQAFIDELVSRVDIVELIDARVPLKKKGRDYMACCPFHGEKTPSFSVSPQKQFYHCFGCGAHGTALGFLMEYDRLEFLDAVRALADLTGMQLPETASGGGKAADGPSLAPLYAQMDEAAALYKRQLKESPRAIEYLKKRGVSGEVAAEFAIGYAPDAWDTAVKALGHDAAAREALVTTGLAIKREGGRDDGIYDRFRDRVMFPIRDARGRVIGFGGRILDQGEPKYLNSPETPLFHKGRELYGLYEARQAERNLERLLVVEGYMDVIALAQHGVRNAVATLGTATTPEHLTRLFRVVREVVFCFDGDKAGRAAAWRALENALAVLADGREVRFLFLPEGEDPDTLVRKEGQEGFQQRLAKAQPLSQYLIDHLREQVNLGTLEGRAKLADLAKPLIARIPESVFRTLVTNRIAELTRVAAQDIARNATDRRGDAPRRGGGRAPAMTPVLTPIRKAIALALLQPTVTAAADPVALRALGQPGLDLLADLCEFFREHPGANAATVVTHWAGTERGAMVERMLTLSVETPEDGVAPEFEGLIADLARGGSRQRRQELEAKLEQLGFAGLSQAEKDEYSALIRTERKEPQSGQNT
jgi:DNA primase